MDFLSLLLVGTVGLVYLYILTTLVDKQRVNKTVINRIGSAGAIQIMFAVIALLLVNDSWIYAIDNEIDSFLNGSLIGNIIGLLAPNVNHGDSVIGMLRGDTYIFLVCIIIVAGIQVYGMSHRKSRAIVETASVLGSVFCIISFYKIADLYDLLFSYKKQEGFIEYLGFSFFQHYLSETILVLKYVVPISLVFIQIYAHNALNLFYKDDENDPKEVSEAIVSGIIIAFIFAYVLYNPKFLSDNSTFTESIEDTSQIETVREPKIIDPKPISYDLKIETVPVQIEDGNTKVSIEWPVLIENEKITSFFQRTICKDALRVESNDIKESVREFINEFRDKRVEYKYDVEANVKVEFKENIGPIAVCNMDNFFDFGGAGASAFGVEHTYHYDCERDFLLTLSDVISDEDATLEIINDMMKKDDKGYDQAATKLPESFQLTKEGVFFIFPKYELGAGYLGKPKFFISYKALYKMMTPYMREKVLTNY